MFFLPKLNPSYVDRVCVTTGRASLCVGGVRRRSVGHFGMWRAHVKMNKHLPLWSLQYPVFLFRKTSRGVCDGLYFEGVPVIVLTLSLPVVRERLAAFHRTRHKKLTCFQINKQEGFFSEINIHRWQPALQRSLLERLPGHLWDLKPLISSLLDLRRAATQLLLWRQFVPDWSDDADKHNTIRSDNRG